MSPSPSLLWIIMLTLVERARQGKERENSGRESVERTGEGRRESGKGKERRKGVVGDCMHCVSVLSHVCALVIGWPGIVYALLGQHFRLPDR